MSKMCFAGQATSGVALKNVVSAPLDIEGRRSEKHFVKRDSHAQVL